jgi:hypothetical protein
MSTSLLPPHGNGNGNGHKPLPPAKVKGSDRPAPAYRPPPWLYQYAFHIARQTAEEQRVPLPSKLAQMCGVSYLTMWRTLSRPEAREWLSQEMRRYLDPDDDVFERIKARVARKALNDDLDAARLWFQVTGRLAKEDSGTKVNNAVTVVLGAPIGGL